MSVLLKVKTQGNTQTVEVAKNVANQAVKIQHVGGNAVYELLDQDTGVAPQQIVTKRVGDDLHITFQDSQDEDLIIADYYNDPALIQGLAENGQYYAYIPANGESASAIAALNDSMLASEVLGGDAIIAGWLPHWGWIAAGVAAIAGIAIAAGSSGSSGSGDTTAPSAPEVTAKANGDVDVKVPANANAGDSVEVKYTDKDGNEKTATLTKQADGSWTSNDNNVPAIPAGSDTTTIKGENLQEGTDVTVIAKDPAGNTSEIATATTDSIPPSSPEVTSGKNGDVTVKVPADAKTGDMVEVKYTDENGEEKTAVLTKQEDGSWASDNEDVPTIPAGSDSTTIKGENLQEGSEVSVIAKDPAGNESAPAATAISDSTAPEAPEVAAKEGGDVEVTVPADAKAGDEVVVKYTDENGEEKTATLTKQEDGSWTTDNEDVPAIPAGSNTTTIDGDNLKEGTPVTVTAKDSLGNESTATVVTPDATAPSAPEATAGKNGDVTVKVPSDAETGDSVEVKYTDENGEEKTATLTKQADGSWTSNNEDVPAIPADKDSTTISGSNLKEGEPVTAVAKDPAGNESAPATATSDATAPSAPQATAGEGGNVTITVPADAEAGDTVEITYKDENGAEKTATLTKQDDGSWTSDNTDVPAIPTGSDTTILGRSVKEGEPVTAVAKDPAGNTSDEATATPDATAPSKPQAEAGEGGDITVTVPADSNPGDSVEVQYTDENGQPQTATLTKQPDGSWASDNEDVPAIPAGQNTTTIDGENLKDGEPVKVVAKDPAGNESEPVIVTSDATAPSAPEATAKAGGDVEIKVPADANPGDTVVITYKDENGADKTATLTKQDDGSWQSNSPDVPMVPAGADTTTISGAQLQEGSPVKAVAKDQAGNTSDEATATSDSTAPSAPVAEAQADGDVEITVPADAKEGDTVEVEYTDENGEEKTAVLTKQADGSWKSDNEDVPDVAKDETSTTIPGAQLQEGAPVTAVAKDPAGNTSDEATATPDKTAPEAPTAEAAEDGDVKVTPPTDATSVEVTYPAKTAGEDPVVVTATKGDDGKWSIDNAPEGVTVDPETGVITVDGDNLNDGDEVKATAKDAAGNESPEATATSDSTAPAAPTAEAVEGGAVEVTPPTDATSVEVSYPNKDGGDDVVVTATKGDDDKWTLPADAPAGVTVDETTGVITISGDNLNDDDVVTATAKDAAGNESPAATAVSDGTAPDAPDVEAAPGGDIDVTPPADATSVEVTYPNKDGGDDVVVTATKGDDDKWTIADAPAGVTIDEDTGIITVSGDNLNDGDEVKAVAKDDAGNVSAEDSAASDSQAPSAPNAEAVEGGAVEVTPPTDADVAKVTVKYGTTEFTATKDADGNWQLPTNAPENVTIDPATGVITIPASELPNDETVTATALDAAENVSGAATATPDSTPPSEPELNAKAGGDVEVTVPTTANEGDTVVITYKDETGAEQTATLTKKADGSWESDNPDVPNVEAGQTTTTIDGANLKEGDAVKAIATDPAGNKSIEATATPDASVTAPTTTEDASLVTITPPTDDDTATVVVKYQNKAGEEVTVTATKDAEGKWTATASDGSTVNIDEATGVITLNKDSDIKDGSPVTATATDALGNTSEDATAAYKTITFDTTPEKPEVTTVAHPDSLTNEERETVKQAVIDANTDIADKIASVEVAEDGKVTVTYTDGSTDEIAGTTVEAITTGTDPIPPAATPVDNLAQLTDEEKAAVKKAVEEANKDNFPPQTQVDVADDGKVTVTYPDGTTDEIPAADVVKQSIAGTTEPNAVQTPVENTAQLTEAEQAKVKDALKEANKDNTDITDITVAEDGTATVTYKDGSTDTIPASQTVKPSIASTTEPAAVQTPVENTAQLTEAEQAKVKAALEEANKDNTDITSITVAQDGTATVTYTDGSTDTIQPADTVKPSIASTTEPAAVQTPVENTAQLTEAEQAKVKAALEEANKDNADITSITVAQDGTATVTYKDGSTDTIQPADTVKPSIASTTDPVAVQTPVGNTAQLTSEEQTKVANALKEANKDNTDITDITVAEDGTATVTYKDGSTDTIQPADTVKEAITTQTNPEKPAVTVVKDPAHLDDTEKAAVKKAVEEANTAIADKIEKVEVAEDGTVTVTYTDGSTDTIEPANTVKAQITKDTDPTAPAATEVSNPDALTQAEKDAIKKAVQDNNTDIADKIASIEVDDKGNVTVTYTDNSQDTIDKSITVKNDVTDAQETDVTPAVTNVKNDQALTAEEKEAVKQAIKDANPDNKVSLDTTTIDVDDKGNVTITYADGSKDTLTPDQTVKDTTAPTANPQVSQAANGDVTFDFNVAGSSYVAGDKVVISFTQPQATEPTVITYQLGTDGTTWTEVDASGNPVTTATIPSMGISTSSTTFALGAAVVKDGTEISIHAEDHAGNKTGSDTETAKDFAVNLNSGANGLTMTEAASNTANGNVTITLPQQGGGETNRSEGGDKIVFTLTGANGQDFTITATKNSTAIGTADHSWTVDTSAVPAEYQSMITISNNNPNGQGISSININDAALKNGSKITAVTTDAGLNTTNASQTAEITLKTVTDLQDAQPYAEVEVSSTTNLSADDKAAIEAAAKQANPNLPADTTYTVNDDGSVTVTYSDGSTDTLASAIKQRADLTAPDVVAQDNGSVTVALPTSVAEGDTVTIKVQVPTAAGGTTAVELTTTYTNGAWTALTPNDAVKAELSGSTVTIPAANVRDLTDVTAITTRGADSLSDTDKAKDLNPELADITAANGKVTVTFPTTGMEAGDKLTVTGDDPNSTDATTLVYTYNGTAWVDASGATATSKELEGYNYVKATVTEADGSTEVISKEYKATLTAPTVTAQENGSVNVGLPTTAIDGDTVKITVPYPNANVDGSYTDTVVTLTYANDAWAVTENSNSNINIAISGSTATVSAEDARDGQKVIAEAFRDDASVGKAEDTAAETTPKWIEFTTNGGFVQAYYPTEGMENGDTVHMHLVDSYGGTTDRTYTYTVLANGEGRWVNNASGYEDIGTIVGNADIWGTLTIDITDASDGEVETHIYRNQAAKAPELRALNDGSVLIYMPIGMEKVTVDYIDENGQSQTATLTAQLDSKGEATGVWTSNDPNVIMKDGSYATLKASAVQDASVVTATAYSFTGNTKDTTTTTKADPSYFKEENLAQTYVGSETAGGDYAATANENKPSQSMFETYRLFGGTGTNANEANTASGNTGNDKLTYRGNINNVQNMWTDNSAGANDAFIIRGDYGDVNNVNRAAFMNMAGQRAASQAVPYDDALIIEGQMKGLSSYTRSDYTVKIETSGTGAGWMHSANGVDTGTGNDLVWIGASNGATNVYYRAEDGTYHLTQVEGSVLYNGTLAQTVASSDSTGGQGGNVVNSDIILGAGNDTLIVEGWYKDGNNSHLGADSYTYDKVEYAAIYNSLVDVGSGMNHIVVNGNDLNHYAFSYNHMIISSWITDGGQAGETTINAQGIQNSHISLTGGGDDTITIEYGTSQARGAYDAWNNVSSTGNDINLGDGIDTLVFTGTHFNYNLSQMSSTAMSAENIIVTGNNNTVTVGLNDLLNADGTVALDAEIGQNGRTVLRIVDEGSNNTVDLDLDKFTKTGDTVVDQGDATYDVYKASGYDNLYVYIEQSFTVI
ncbi:hypothetical protein [Lonepinella sp. BR2271]|uniref:hypothetical protein n=1 Tax=Lonepinella sp. BR2271 TaxID=3434550 RepID=UPI003F6E1628